MTPTVSFSAFAEDLKMRVLWGTDGSQAALGAASVIQNLLVLVAASIQVITVAPRKVLIQSDQRHFESQKALDAAFSIAGSSAQTLDAPDGLVVPRSLSAIRSRRFYARLNEMGPHRIGSQGT